MNLSRANAKISDIPFNDADFKAIASLAQNEFGLNLSESKKPLVYSRLSKRLKARNLTYFPDYLNLLEQPEEESERLELISALTTNVTSFFRESHHFETLHDECIPKFIDKISQGERIRLWSAGCSSGQEAYSIAMTILSKIPDARNRNIKILATDIDPKIIEKAKTGHYNAEEKTSIPVPLYSKWVKPHRQSEIEITAEARSLVTFAELNLMSKWPFAGPFDVIFCRNVAIYFNQPTQQKLWCRFSNMLADNGHLFIGHSERVTGPASSQLTGVGITSYQKNGPDGR